MPVEQRLVAAAPPRPVLEVQSLAKPQQAAEQALRRAEAQEEKREEEVPRKAAESRRQAC